MIIQVIEVIIFAFLKYLESWHLRESPLLKPYRERMLGKTKGDSGVLGKCQMD
jgi:hypothetical protein